LAKKKAKGKLPPFTWLRNNGFGGLNRCMDRYPELFAHIEQEYEGGRSLEENVKLAEKIAEEHNGILPIRAWLYKNGYGGMVQKMEDCPEAFAHIKQNRFKKTCEDYRKEARIVADEHDGILPSFSWLSHNGLEKLAQYIRKNKDKFKDFKQKKKIRSLDEWVEYAEGLEQKHGKLPCSAWLRKNNLGGLSISIRSHPARYAHIQQDRKLMTLDHWVKVAEDLEKEHGEIPCQRKLRQMKLSGLVSSMRLHPDEYAHIKKEYRGGNTIHENVILARQVAKENGGILPHYAELQRQKRYGLSLVVRKYPVQFKGIKQYYFDANQNRGVRTLG